MKRLQSKKVFLVTSSPNGAENLSLQYLAGSLKRAGYRPDIRLFRGTAEGVKLATWLANRKCLFIGVSIPSGESAVQLLPFIHYLRQQGCRSHICVGGVFATLARERMLATHPIDSVVSHDGEYAVCELAKTLQCGGDMTFLAGVATKENSGGNAAQPRRLEQVDSVPARGRPRRYMGVPSAKICGSRGCHGRCSYCGLAAAGHMRACQPRDYKTGESPVLRRSAASIANEMAGLYHEQGVRFFHFIDENLLPPVPADGAHYLNELCDFLDEANVTSRAVSLMMRADALNADVAAALARLGLSRSLLGVESNSDSNLARMRRGYLKETNQRAVALMETTGALYHYNILLVHPDSVSQHIREEIDALDNASRGLIDPHMVQLYEGTAAFNRAQQAGRLLGGPYLWHYWPQETGARRFARLFYHLRVNSRVLSALTGYMHDTLGALVAHERLGFIHRQNAYLRELKETLVLGHNSLWKWVLNELWHLSRNTDAIGETDVFFAAVEQRAGRLLQQTMRLKKILEKESSQNLLSDIFSVSHGAAAAALLSICIGSGCHRTGEVLDDTDTVNRLADTVTGSESEGEKSTDGGSVDTENFTATHIDTGDEDTDTLEDCSWEDACSEVNELFYTEEIGSCGDDCARYPDDAWCGLEVNEDGYVVGVLERQAHAEGDALPAEYVQCVVDALADQQFPCLAAYQLVWRLPPIELE